MVAAGGKGRPGLVNYRRGVRACHVSPFLPPSRPAAARYALFTGATSAGEAGDRLRPLSATEFHARARGKGP